MARVKAKEETIDEDFSNCTCDFYCKKWNDVPYTERMGIVDPKELIENATLAGVFAYDIETNDTLDPREGRIDCISFYVPPLNGAKEIWALYPFVDGVYVIWDGNIPRSIRQRMDQKDTMEKLRPLAYLPKVLKLSANGKFDNAWYDINPGTDTPIIFQDPMGDSQIADYTSDERRMRYGLKYRVKDVFGHHMTPYKEASKRQIAAPFMKMKPLGLYSMEDPYFTYVLHEHAISELKRQDPTGKLEKIYWNMEMPIRRIIQEMEQTGCLIDFDHLLNLERRLEKEKLDIIEKIVKEKGWSPNLRSPKQISDFLFNTDEEGGLGLPTDGIEQGINGSFSTSEKVIKHFGRKNEIVRLLLEYRSLEVIDRSFCKKLIKIAQIHGRVRTGFSQTTTVTGRLSCVSGDTLIETNKGNIEISSIEPSEGIKVTSHTGESRKILETVYKGLDEIFEVMLENGKSIKCTKKHKFLTSSGWKSLEQLKETDKVISYE